MEVVLCERPAHEPFGNSLMNLRQVQCKCGRMCKHAGEIEQDGAILSVFECPVCLESAILFGEIIQISKKFLRPFSDDSAADIRDSEN
jgi:hypothetical protein